MKYIYETFLPMFNGFDYGSYFEIDYDYISKFIQQERKDKGLFSDYDINELKIDYARYENDIVIQFCYFLKTELSDFILDIEFQEIVKNSANVKIKILPEKVKSFIYEHKEKFCEFLKKRYTSYDGFFSHYANDFETWENETKNFSDFSCNGHYIGAILEFIAIQENVNECSIAQDILENIYVFEYVENLEDIINMNDGSLFEALTSKGIEKSFADYIENSYNNKVLSSLSLSEKVLSVIREYENSLVEA